MNFQAFPFQRNNHSLIQHKTALCNGCMCLRENSMSATETGPVHLSYDAPRSNMEFLTKSQHSYFAQLCALGSWKNISKSAQRAIFQTLFRLRIFKIDQVAR